MTRQRSRSLPPSRQHRRSRASFFRYLWVVGYVGGEGRSMPRDSFDELVTARHAYVNFLKRYANCRDAYSLDLRKQLAQRLEAAEANWERGRAG